MSRVTSLRDDLAYALAAREELRIIAPIPGKQAVGVEVPNPEASLVTLGDIYRDFPDQAGPLVAWLGLDIGGKADLPRPGPDAAPAHRRLDRHRQERLPQRPPGLDPAARDARTSCAWC